MLKQILRDMYVDPEILAGLDETYKQILFCKMREEQIRRWRVWDEEQQKIEINNNRNLKNNQRQFNSSSNNNKIRIQKQVSFRLGEDGEPWVWVMGEHPDDLTIDEILEEEAKQKARILAENEFRQNSKNENENIIELKPTSITTTTAIIEPSSPKIEDYEIYCSVDELRNFNKNDNLKAKSINYITNDSKIDVLQEISYNKPPSSTQKVSARIALWEQRTIGERTSEIFKQIQMKKQEVAKEAEEAAKREEELWKEQERKAKQAEIQMREIARRAREEHRKSLNCDEQQQHQEQITKQTNIKVHENSNSSSTNSSNNSSPLNSLDLSILLLSRPPNQDAVINWYRTIEFPKKCGINSVTNKPENWFHGLLTRTEAENLLNSQEQGTFLIRLSEKIWGYAISYKDVDRCKHYLIDASSNSKYKFIGHNQLEHESLGDLLRHHASIPITILGNELLLRPCPSTVTIPPILKDLV